MVLLIDWPPIRANAPRIAVPFCLLLVRVVAIDAQALQRAVQE
jgi:hypothetical protein